MHMGQFANPVERWLYFVFGLAGSGMIATGLVLWLSKRQLKHAREARPPFGLQVVATLNLAGIAGLITAVAAYFCANRLLPLVLTERSDWEVRVFFLVWLGSLLHAALRPTRQGWVEQLSVATVLYLSLPLLGMLTTSRGLTHAIAANDWAMAGVDLSLLGCAGTLGWLARKLALKGVPDQASARAARVVS